DREVPRHELDDRPEADHGRPDPHAREPRLGDRRVDDALLAEAREHPFRHLVRAVVVPDLLAHEEDRLVALHLLAHRLAERFAEAQDAGLRHRRARTPSRARGTAIPRRTGPRPALLPSPP